MESMDRSKRPSLASPSMAAKPEGSKPRKKLQKGCAKQRNYLTKRPGSGTSNETATDNNKLDTVNNKPSLPLPPDLSDSKWAEYLRSGVYLYTLDPSALPPSDTAISPPATAIPEHSHLVTTTNHEKPRSSAETVEPNSSSSYTAIMRRRAKTPVHSVGQVETDSDPRSVMGTKTSPVESLAEKYRAQLDSGDAMFTESHSEPPSSRQEDKEPFDIRRQHSSDGLSQGNSELPTGSPTSDDGTLVSIEEETVYFKPVSFSPVSFSPEPLYPIHTMSNKPEQPAMSPSLAPDSLSLRVCVDLLARDLATALTKKSRKTVACLQIWVMIEAYERLRDQILDSRSRYEEVRNLELMFDTWLRALYAVYDSLSGDGRRSESDCEELGLTTPDLD